MLKHLYSYVFDLYVFYKYLKIILILVLTMDTEIDIFVSSKANKLLSTRENTDMTTTNVYDKQAKHFSKVSAWVIVNDQGEKTGTMTAKYPNDGMGKLFLYLHLHGSEMVQVSVSGCGFDKLSVAVQKAAEAYSKDLTFKTDRDFIEALKDVDHDFSTHNTYATYRLLQAV